MTNTPIALVTGGSWGLGSSQVVKITELETIDP
jgi:hypothetical protein